jgi:hypothetical protein
MHFVKLKFNTFSVVKAQRGSRGIVILFLEPRSQIDWVVVKPQPLYPQKRLGIGVRSWFGIRTGPDGYGKSHFHRVSIH